jgi:hypothetical protein
MHSAHKAYATFRWQLLSDDDKALIEMSGWYVNDMLSIFLDLSTPLTVYIYPTHSYTIQHILIR